MKNYLAVFTILALLGVSPAVSVAKTKAPAATTQEAAPQAKVEATDPAAPETKEETKEETKAAETTKKDDSKKTKLGKKRPTFLECDKDADGFLSKEEYIECFPRSQKKFDKVDANNDGKLTRDEIKAYGVAKKEAKTDSATKVAPNAPATEKTTEKTTEKAAQ